MMNMLGAGLLLAPFALVVAIFLAVRLYRR